MKKAIEIEELRVSSNGRYIEFIINCPYDYLFTAFNILVGDNDEEFSIADSLFYKNNTYITDTDNRFIGQIPVELLGADGPEIYRVHLEAEHKTHTSEYEQFIDFNGTLSDTSDDVLVDTDLEKVPETIYADAWISDVSHAYQCLMDDILSLLAKCSDKEALDRVIRNYLTLYAHQEALRLGYIDEATKWFDLIANCFTGKCKGSKDRNVKSSCGCGRQSMLYMPMYNSGCGCKR